MSTPAQIAAAVANAQHSTGPRTVEGKAASSRNATKFGIFSQTDILPGEDPEEYAALIRELEDKYQPADSLERQLVRDMVRGIWLGARYDRIEHEVMQIRYAGLDPADCDHPLGAIYILDDKVLEKIERRRNTVRRRGQQAFRELLALQKGRP